MIIEICATSIESILNAENAGAHRLELCQNYSIGGVTPSEQFLHEAIKVSSLPINVLIRPKGGDFIFNDKEYDLMINKINLFKVYNVKGFVIGFMEKDRSLNSDILLKLVSAGTIVNFVFKFEKFLKIFFLHPKSKTTT